MESLLPSLAMIKVSEEGVQWIRNGRPVSAEQIADAEGNGSPVLRDDPTIIVRVFSPDGRLIALARPAARPGHFAPFLVLY
jgi:hypothetical protein